MDKLYRENSSKKGGVYKIINKINNRIYIGSTVRFQTRAYQHLYQLENNCHSNKFLQNDFNKCGTKNFSFEILDIIENISKEKAKDTRLNLEQIYLNKYFDLMNQCYNIDKFVRSTKELSSSVPYNKGKTYEEIYGLEKATELKIKLKNAHKYQKSPNKGKTFIELYGKEKAEKLKQNQSILVKTNLKCLAVQFKKSCSLEEQFGVQKAQEIKKKRIEKITGPNNSHFGIPRTNEVKEKIGEKNSKYYNLALNPLVSPDGTEYNEIRNLTEFCKNNLISRNLGSVLNGKRKYCEGKHGGIWKLKINIFFDKKMKIIHTLCCKNCFKNFESKNNKRVYCSVFCSAEAFGKKGIGRKHTEECKKLMSENSKGIKNHMFGKTVSKETRQKTSEKLKNFHIKKASEKAI